MNDLIQGREALTDLERAKDETTMMDSDFMIVVMTMMMRLNRNDNKITTSPTQTYN